MRVNISRKSPPKQLPENWKAVPDCPAYEVSNCGRVRRANPYRTSNKPGKVMTPNCQGDVLLYSEHSTGYGSAIWRIGVAELILLTFRGQPALPGVGVEYADGNAKNYRLDNLSWKLDYSYYLRKKMDKDEACKTPERITIGLAETIASIEQKERRNPTPNQPDQGSRAQTTTPVTSVKIGRPKDTPERQVERWTHLLAVVPTCDEVPMPGAQIAEEWEQAYGEKINMSTLYKRLGELVLQKRITTEPMDLYLPEQEIIGGRGPLVGYRHRHRNWAVTADYFEFLNPDCVQEEDYD